MRVPAPFELNELNRIIGTVQELCEPNKDCEIRSIADLCSTYTFGGRPSNHRRIIRLAQYTGLLSKGAVRVSITKSGDEFLNLNYRSTYEVTNEQKEFVIEEFLLNGPWKSKVRGCFLIFDPEHSKVTFEYDTTNNQFPIRYAALLHLLKFLGMIIDESGILRVEAKYVSHVVHIRADESKGSIDDLEAALDAKRKFGALAEDAVVEFERDRLRALGRDLEASLVRKISTLDYSAGYDIESYNGDAPLFDYDRFVEVKASQYADVQFHWTSNERCVAEILREKYWIYFVPNFNSKTNLPIEPIMINDPFKRIGEISGLSIEPSKYLITQTSEINLVTFSCEEKGGFFL